MIHIAAAGDVHFGADSAGSYRARLHHLAERADVFLLAGDLTRVGEPAEAKVLADELRDLAVPTVAVLGNHDYHADRSEEVTAVLESAGIEVLEGTATVVDVGGLRLGIAGTTGFGGGFPGAGGSEFGEREMKAFMAHSRYLAERLEAALCALDVDVKVALLHYSPCPATLAGEPLEIYPFLGSGFLADAVDRAGAALALHGHAHRGSPEGATPAGVPVRNVALPVIGHAYTCFDLTVQEAFVG
ncbi:MAG TPA: metallophosphoesterase [Acidimicrobiia bacterium]|nr:metallophosphoesterase [Acidimicrobiia bacterium]